MLGGDEEDVDFLSPTGGAKLASLFGLDQSLSGQENESFQYTAPKQPKKGQAMADKKTSKAAAAGAPQVLCATAVHVYRFISGQYVKQGKFGVAVLANHVTKEYRILLYVSQQQPVAAARIHPEFTFTVQPNNYSNFYDDQRENWSLMFESEKAACDFNKQICIAKCNSKSSLDSVLYQDLVLGEGQAVEVGDLMEVSYTGWLFQNNGLGQVFDSNINKDKLLRLKLGSGKVIKGWEEGMVGLKKGGKRLLIIPPALAYGSQGVAGRIPPNSTLVFEVEVKRVKFKDSGPDRQSIDSRDSTVPSPVSSTDGFSVEPPMLPPSKPGEPAVRAKSNSITEQLANPDVAKAKLISRMAKMGQPMLPFLAGSPTLQPDSSDSELEDPSIMKDSVHPVTLPPVRRTLQLSHATPPQLTTQVPQQTVPGLQTTSAALLPVATIQTQPNVPEHIQSFQPYTGVAYTYSPGQASSSQLQPIGQMYPATISQPPHFQASGDVTSFLMTEARQHNTEIRMAVSKVADKIDQLASKVDEFQKQNTGGSLLTGLSSFTMETAMIMNNIQRIIQENERLKQEVFDKSSRIEEQNEKISALIQRNQRYVEQSNLLMEQRNDSLKTTTENTQTRLLHAEQEKAKVAEELTAATGQVSRLQLELSAHQKEEMNLRSQLTAALQEAEKNGLQLNKLQAQLLDLQETSEHAQSHLKTEKQSRRQLELKVTSLEEELADLIAEKHGLEKNLAERKKKSHLERQQAEEEMEEIRKSYQAELDKLRQVLIKARTSTDQATAEQMSLVQTELESQWQAKCDRLLSSAREQHSQQYQEVCKQREDLQHRLAQLEEKLLAIKQSRDAENWKLASFQEQTEQLEPLKEKCSALQSQIVALKENYEERIQELKKTIPLAKQGKTQAPDTTEEVKKIMNSVFQHLREEFELEELYSGRAVLSIVMNTIKTVTLQLLSRQAEQEKQESSSEEEEETDGKVMGENAEGIQQEISSKVKEEPQAIASNIQTQNSEHHKEPEDLEQSSTVCELEGNNLKGQEEEHVTKTSSKVHEEESATNKTILTTSQETPESFTQLTAADQGPIIPAQVEEALYIVLSEHSEVPTENRAEQKEENTATIAEAVIEKGSIIETTAGEIRSAEKLMGNHEKKDQVESEATKVEQVTTLPLASKDDAVEPASEGDRNLLDVIMLDPAEANVNEGGSFSESKAGQHSIPKSDNSSVREDERDSEDLFKMAVPKPLKLEATSKQEEEEEEDDVSMKGRPPPAPLFGDDEEEDDLDWLN
ncbi:FK506-binding protein 15 isoform X3 [Rhinatrema bivittatum]|uniref:FK506-binding protein 15 isoform X3 n=1 Tax=Rhinatrema bivittatum TaxID=194408 RepID=UPI001127A53A|nr:FK506-binding protein 15 isoform X3 [Rhinatrema bivittatum]